MNSAKSQPGNTSPLKWVSFWKSKKNILFLSAILIISFMVYIPSLQNGFVPRDDPQYVYDNPYIITISSWGDILTNVKGIFTTTVISSYKPLVILSFAFEKVIYGLDSPGWWHLSNIFLHLICVLLVFRISLALGLKLIPAAFCALLFGIHPMRVESVAWITERKDVLYGSFYLLALYYYIKSVKMPFKRRYLLIIYLSFILSLLSKIQAVTLPLAMLTVDYYFDRRLSMKLIYEKWLYFLLSLAIGILGIYFLRIGGILEQNEGIVLLKRVFMGSYAYVVYIIKSVVPYEMVPIYPFPDTLGWTFYASMAIALFILGSIYYFFRKKMKALVFGLLFFTFNVMFLLQFKVAGNIFLSDRYTYIAYFGLFFIYAFLFQSAEKKYKKFDKLIYLNALLILGLFWYMNFEQNKIWKNGETLWSHVIKYYPGDSLNWHNRGTYYQDEERLEKALDDYNKAIVLAPYAIRTAGTYNNRGNIYLEFNQPDSLRLALQDYTKAIQISPNSSLFFVNRGRTYIKLDMFDNALQDLNEAERLEPTNHLIYEYRAKFFYKLGQDDKALSDIEKFLSLKPNNPAMWLNFGTVSRLNKQYEESLNAFNRAIQINPEKLSYYYARLKTYYEMGDIQRARNDLNFLKSKGFKGISPDYERLINLEK